MKCVEVVEVGLGMARMKNWHGFSIEIRMSLSETHNHPSIHSWTQEDGLFREKIEIIFETLMPEGFEFSSDR